MSDCGHHDEHTATGGRLKAALIVILAFMVVEVIGGLLSGSLALLADAAHMLTDAMALGLALVANSLSRRPAGPYLHFGYRRAQVLAAFVNGLLLVALLMWIVVEAVQRIAAPQEVDWRFMIVVAAIGLAANAVAFRLLLPSGHDNMNVRGALLHVMSDLAGSVAAVIAACIIALTGWMAADPILSILVALLIGRSAWLLLRDSAHILLQGAPRNFDLPAMTRDLMGRVADVEDIHGVRVWQMAPGHLQLTMHAKLRKSADAEQALAKLKDTLANDYGVKDATVQISCEPSCRAALGEGSEHLHAEAEAAGKQPARGVVVPLPRKATTGPQPAR